MLSQIQKEKPKTNPLNIHAINGLVKKITREHRTTRIYRWITCIIPQITLINYKNS